MSGHKRDFRLLIFLFDFLLLNAAFFTTYYVGQKTGNVSGNTGKLLISVYVVWLGVFIAAKRYRLDAYKNYLGAVLFSGKSVVFLAYGLSVLIVLFHSASISRFLIFGTCLVWALLQVLVLTLVRCVPHAKWNNHPVKRSFRLTGISNISPSLLAADAFLLGLSFFLVNFLKRGSFRLEPFYLELLLLLLGLWLAVSFVTRKYDHSGFQNYSYALAVCVKTAFLATAIISVLIVAFRLDYFSGFQIYGCLLVLLVFEAAFFCVYFLFRAGRARQDDVESIEALKRYIQQADLPCQKQSTENGQNSDPSHMKIVLDRIIKRFPDLFEFVRTAADVEEISDAEIALLNTQDLESLEILPGQAFRLAINFERVNDVRWLNKFLLEIHTKLVNGGYFVGKVHSQELHKQGFFKRYPRYYGEVFYVFYFLIHRVLPKLARTRAAYFAFTKGRNRCISRAEILGRLHFCGFKVLAEKEIGENLFFVAQKAKTPSLDESPSYDLIIRLKRVGWNGRIIEVRKFRTMHPYSEYLQDYTYRNHQLKEGGKLRNDFRVTGWGRFMRKYWLDELPMIYNWLRGEIKLFGVRPLSRHYLSLYDQSVQDMRKKFKPGLIPPFYADMPEEFAQIVESERSYLQAYKCHPWRTQWVYLLRALKNILFRGARSG